MAARKMTFSLPEQLARTLVKRIPARERSRFLAQALERSLREEEADLARACSAANSDPKSKALEREWDQVQDEIEEPWNHPPTR
jgi:metal-responsive CopG/Arc/MetJ family transcriptional regulator